MAMVGLDNMAQIVESRNQLQTEAGEGFSKFSTDNTNLMAPKTTRFNPNSKPKMPPGGIVSVFIVSMIPAVVQLIVLIASKGTLTTLAVMVAAYALLIFLHYRLVDRNAWNSLKTQDISPSMTSGRFKTDFVLTASVAALAFAIVTILYSSYIPLGPSEIDIYLPAGNIFMRIIYWLLYISIHILVLPVLETAFFSFMIFYYIHYSLPFTGILAGVYGLTNFAWIVVSIWGVGWIIFLTLACGGLGWLYLVAARKESLLKALGMRTGVAAGLMIYLIVLNTVFGGGRVSSPQQYNTAW